MSKNKYFLTFSLINVALMMIVLAILFSTMVCSCRKNKEGLSNQKEFVLIHMKDCGHCKTLMPEWEEASKNNKSGINMRAVEMNEGDGPELCKKHNISGFPTMIVLENGEKVKDYDGKRNKDGLLSFLNTL